MLSDVAEIKKKKKKKSSEFANESLNWTEVALQHTLIIIQGLSRILSAGWKKNTGKEKKIEKNKHSQCVKNRMSLPVENKLPEATRSMSETRSWSIFFHQTYNLLVIVIKQKQVGGYWLHVKISPTAKRALSDQWVLNW